MSKKEQLGSLYGRHSRNRSGVQTEFSERNLHFINARKHAFDGNREQMEASIKAMSSFQPVTKREREAIERKLPERRQPMPRQ